MKQLIFSLSLLISGIPLASCGEMDARIPETNPASFRKPVEIYVFIDKSASVSFADSSVQKRAIRKLSELIPKLRTEHDRLSFCFIHSNTSAAGFETNLQFKAFHYPPNINSMERLMYDNQYHKERGIDSLNCVKKLMELFHYPPDSTTRLKTDIIGVLDFVSQHSGLNSEKYIVMLTDGKHDANGLKCNPRNLTESADLLKKHLASIPDFYRINKASLSGTIAWMLLPYNPSSTSHNVCLNPYWEDLFKYFDVKLTIH